LQIKVFKASNMKDAMAAMKAELGEDAVILHSKKYKEGGILGIGSREVVEITAAVEENSLPKKTEPTQLKHPTVLNRYKTDGTAQGVAGAEQAIENLSNEPKDEIPRPIQLDELAEKISEQKKSADSPKNFENILQDTQENLSPEVEASPVEENPSPEVEVPPVEENSSPEVESSPVEENSSPEVESSPVEENLSPEVEVPPVEENPSPEVEVPPVEENLSPEVEVPPVVKKSAPEVKAPPVKKSSPEVEAPPVKKSSPEVKAPPVKKSSPEVKAPPVKKSAPKAEQKQQATTFTQEQMAQAQAMIMAQFNQMQMMQQAAIAQAQAQAAEQIRLQQAAQAQQVAQVQSQPAIQSEEKIKHLEEEIAQMKALLADVLGRDSKKSGVSLHEALKRQEVDEDILKEMAANANPGETLVEMHEPGAKTTLINYLSEHMRFSDGIKLNRHGVRIVALLGTTGVGKTTTLAKIAAKFVLEQRANVALITADTYRISAVEQLKTYSDILELPLEIVYNPSELSAAIERHRNKELILIDTAGRSQHNEYQMRELEEFLRINPRIEKHLVISATTKYTDAKQIMNKFSQVNPDKIIFTKIDETGSLGMIVNLLNDNRYSLSYITTGQSVPDDIERASSEIIANLLLEKVEE